MNPTVPLPFLFYLVPVVLILLISASWYCRKSNRDQFFGLIFFLVTIAVTLRYVAMGDSFMAERYTYVPYIGLGILAGSLAEAGLKQTRFRIPVIVLFLLFTTAFTATTFSATRVWKNSFTFWGNVAEHYPRYWRSYSNLGQEYLKSGDYEKALTAFSAACERDPFAPQEPFLSRGALYVNHLNDPGRGIADFMRVLSYPDENHPSKLEACRNLGIAWLRTGEPVKALSILDEAISMNPGQYDTWYMKGAALTVLNRLPEAEEAYTRSLTLNPAFTETWMRRGILYTDKLNDYDKGLADFRKVLEMKPGDRNATVNMGICYSGKGLYSEAIGTFTEAINGDPADGMQWYFRSQAYAGLKDYRNALADAEEAVRRGVAVPVQELDVLRKRAGNKQ